MARPDSWFRLYNAAVDNPKVQRLPEALFKAWVNLLCIASRNGGRLPAVADIAFILRVSDDVARSWLEALEGRRLFERDGEGRLAPHDWDELQYKRVPSTERVKRFRQRAANHTETPTETPHETPTETVSETLPEQIRAEQIRSEPPNPRAGGLGSREAFLKFWEAYPEKVGRKAAHAAWDAARDRPALADVLEAVARYIAAKPAHRAWCAPARWLREGRWNDAPASPSDSSADPSISGRSASQWRWGARLFAEKKYWPPSFGPAPGLAGCECPVGILEEFCLSSPPSPRKQRNDP